MKTLKQIREDYNDKFISQVENLPEELMLEEKAKIVSVIPSNKDMPSLLIFRRISFRLYPNKQTVALYYSKIIDKYLSIPFGPGGNVNLSESIIADTLDALDEACRKKYEHVDMKEKSSKVITNRVPVEEQGSSATRYTERPTYEHYKSNIEKLRHQQNEGIADVADTVADVVVPYYSAGKKLYKGDYKGAAKDAAVDTAMMAVGGPLVRTAAKGLKAGAGLVRKGVSKLTGRGQKSVARDASAMTKSSTKPLAPKKTSGVKSAIAGAAAGAAVDAATKAADSSGSVSNSTGKIRDLPTGKSYSSWETATHKDPVYASKERQARLAPVKENKITDIRTMVKEGIEDMDLSINGRQVTLNTTMAKRILEVYDSVNTKNKKIVEGMLNEDLESFKKLLNFSIRK